MAEKQKVCKECGFINAGSMKKCENCGSNQFVDKYKGRVLVLRGEESEVAKKLNIENNGAYALKYG